MAHIVDKLVTREGQSAHIVIPYLTPAIDEPPRFAPAAFLISRAVGIDGFFADDKFMARILVYKEQLEEQLDVKVDPQEEAAREIREAAVSNGAAQEIMRYYVEHDIAVNEINRFIRGVAFRDVVYFLILREGIHIQLDRRPSRMRPGQYRQVLTAVTLSRTPFFVNLFWARIKMLYEDLLYLHDHEAVINYTVFERNSRPCKLIDEVRSKYVFAQEFLHKLCEAMGIAPVSHYTLVMFLDETGDHGYLINATRLEALNVEALKNIKQIEVFHSGLTALSAILVFRLPEVPDNLFTVITTEDEEKARKAAEENKKDDPTYMRVFRVFSAVLRQYPRYGARQTGGISVREYLQQAYRRAPAAGAGGGEGGGVGAGYRTGIA